MKQSTKKLTALFLSIDDCVCFVGKRGGNGKRRLV